VISYAGPISKVMLYKKKNFSEKRAFRLTGRGTSSEFCTNCEPIIYTVAQRSASWTSDRVTWVPAKAGVIELCS